MRIERPTPPGGEPFIPKDSKKIPLENRIKKIPDMNPGGVNVPLNIRVLDKVALVKKIRKALE